MLETEIHPVYNSCIGSNNADEEKEETMNAQEINKELISCLKSYGLDDYVGWSAQQVLKELFGWYGGDRSREVPDVETQNQKMLEVVKKYASNSDVYRRAKETLDKLKM